MKTGPSPPQIPLGTVFEVILDRAVRSPLPRCLSIDCLHSPQLEPPPVHSHRRKKDRSAPLVWQRAGHVSCIARFAVVGNSWPEGEGQSAGFLANAGAQGDAPVA